jgi:hypothetical protein
MKGIYLGDYDSDGNKELFINANYISTGILRSENNNMTINLNNGKIESNNFILNAMSDNAGIYLNSNPLYSNSYYFLVGD